MGQRSNDAAAKDARTLSLGKRLPKRSPDTNALLMDVQIKLNKEECALSTEQSSNDAAAKDAQIKLRLEECA